MVKVSIRIYYKYIKYYKYKGSKYTLILTLARAGGFASLDKLVALHCCHLSLSILGAWRSELSLTSVPTFKSSFRKIK